MFRLNKFNFFGSCGFNRNFGLWSVVRDGNGGFLASGAVVDFDPILVEPEFNFVVAVLGFGGEFQNVDFDFFATVQIASDDVGEFGDGAGANVAFDAIFVFVHEEEGVGLVEVFIEAFVDFGHASDIIRIIRRKPATEGKSGFGLGLVESFLFG